MQSELCHITSTDQLVQTDINANDSDVSLSKAKSEHKLIQPEIIDENQHKQIKHQGSQVELDVNKLKDDGQVDVKSCKNDGMVYLEVDQNKGMCESESYGTFREILTNFKGSEGMVLGIDSQKVEVLAKKYESQIKELKQEYVWRSLIWLEMTCFTIEIKND